ncbi:MAG TPA: cytochrome P450 [Acidimicrobiales bacterium]|nr:cytochrome P450 [Acidimicrobiales bacterium]
MTQESIAEMPLSEIDLSDMEFWARPWEEREAAFRTLRSQRPIAFFEEPEVDQSVLPIPKGPGYYAITRYADVQEISRHPELYCSGKGATSILDMPLEFLEFFGGMINEDDPRHARLRRIVSAAFNPRMVQSIEEGIQRVAGTIVDKLVEVRTCDFVTDVAARLPLQVICDMMGVAERDYDLVFRCSNIILSAGDPEYIPEGTDIAAAFLQAGSELAQLMQELASFRSEHPTDDLTSALIHANVDGEALDHSELASFFVLLVVAGNETTRNAISHGLWAFTEYPDQKMDWVVDFATTAATAVDEIVRWASPVIFMRRTVTQKTELSGQEFAEGDKVLLFYNSANRDEEIFDEPYKFDVSRHPNPHLGFGAAGPHFCLGAHLARREIMVMFRELFARTPNLVATAEPDRLRSNFINGIKHLPCDTGSI